MGKTITTSIQYPSPPEKGSGNSRRQSYVSNQRIEELPNCVVLGQIFLSWKTLQPYSQGIKGFFTDVKNIRSHELKERKTQHCYHIDARMSKNHFEYLNLKKILHSDHEILSNGEETSRRNSRNNELTNSNSLRDASIKDCRRKRNKLSQSPESYKTLDKNFFSEDAQVPSYTGTYTLDKELLPKEECSRKAYSSFPITTCHENQPSDTDELQPLLKVKDPTHSNNKTCLWTLYGTRLKSFIEKSFILFPYFPNTISWRDVFSAIWADCLQLVNFFLLHKNLAKLKKQQILRNITRRSHPVCSLLFFPICTNVNLLKKNSTKYSSRIKKKKKAAFLLKLKNFQSSRFYQTRNISSNSNHQKKNIQTLVYHRKKSNRDVNNNSLFFKLPRLSRDCNNTTSQSLTQNSSLNCFRSNGLRKNDVLLKHKKNKCYQSSYTHNLSRSPLISKSAIANNTLRYRNTLLAHAIKGKKIKNVSYASRIVNSNKNNSISDTQGSDSNYSYSTIKSDNFDTNSSLKASQHSVLAIKKTLAHIKKPRVLIYGGAINDSLEGCRGDPCDCLSEFSLYTLLRDKPERIRGISPEYIDLPEEDVNHDSSRIFVSDDNRIMTLKDTSCTSSEKTTFVKNEKKQSRDKHQYIFQLNSKIFEMSSRNTDEFHRNSLTDKSSSVDTTHISRLQYQPDQLTVKGSYANAFDECVLQWNEVLSYKTRTTSLNAFCHLSTNHETPSARFGSSSVSYKGRLYLFGGAKVSEWKRFTLMNDFWVLSVGTPDNFSRLGLNSSRYSKEKLVETGYIWSQVPLNTALRPPPCAFHLACVSNGFMYLLISECSVADGLEDLRHYFENIAYDGRKLSDHRLLLEAELMSARNKCINETVLNAYMKQLNQKKTSLNQIWRINLDVMTPQWELFPVTISKRMTQMVKGGIALTVYCDRIYVYGAFIKQSHVAIGVLDLNLKMWVTSVKLAGAPVWVTAVAIGKLWVLLGVESWGIFNLETFEWRYSNAPPKAHIRYGCRALWLPPYLPFPYNDNISANSKMLHGIHDNITKFILQTDLPSQYLSLLLQCRRPMDNVHTLLLFGGFNSDGQLSNQVDQILVVLPPELSLNCFLPMRKEENSFYASLFDVNTLHGESPRADEEIPNIKEAIRKGRALDEKYTVLQRLRESLDECQTNGLKREKIFQMILRDMELRNHFEQEKLKRQLLNKERIIDRLKLQLKKKKLICKINLR